MLEHPKHLAAWLRLTLTPSVGGETQRLLLAAFGLPEHIFDMSASALSKVVPRHRAQALLTHDNRKEVEAALAWAAEPDNHILTLADVDYPQRLLEMPDPPTVLYIKGRVDLLNRPSVAIVGSRSATPQGESTAHAFAQALSEADITIISGLALGIDAGAHRGGLQGHGSTIAVIGTGADRVYPAKNRALAKRIAESGAIISEFPLDTRPLTHNFPLRNRLIAGLSHGCLVVEAATASGSLITARLAAEQGREVFAIPGSIHSPMSKGCHQLIKEGAKLVDDVQDILQELRLNSPQTRAPHSAIKPSVEGEEGQLLDCMGSQLWNIDTLTERSSLTPDRLYAMLLSLELAGHISAMPGGRFQRIYT